MRLLLEVEPVRVNPRTDAPKTIEQMERELDVHDALQYQQSAQSNSYGFRYMRDVHGQYQRSTERLATIQYAYARWLLGIDDYYLTLKPVAGHAIAHRPHRRGHGDHTPVAAAHPAAMDLARQRLLTPWTPGAWRRQESEQ